MSQSIQLNINESFITAPGGVDVQQLNFRAQIVSSGTKYGGAYRSATLEVGGIYEIRNSATGTTRTYEAPTKLTHKVTSDQHQATLTIEISSGKCSVSSIMADNQRDAIASIASQAPAVVAAVAALIGMNAAAITASGLPAVADAFVAACASPPSVPTEDAATPVLAADGWVKS